MDVEAAINGRSDNIAPSSEESVASASQVSTVLSLGLGVSTLLESPSISVSASTPDTITDSRESVPHSTPDSVLESRESGPDSTPGSRESVPESREARASGSDSWDTVSDSGGSASGSYCDKDIAAEKDMNEKILSYRGVVITHSDRALLESPCTFMNDQMIEFYFKYLETCYGEDNDVMFISPCVSFLLTNCSEPESLRSLIEPLKLDEKKLIFLTVNDNPDVSQDGGGRHWSLLVYYRTLHTFVHHDSARGLNNESAYVLYNAIKPFVGKGAHVKLTFRSLRKYVITKRCGTLLHFAGDTHDEASLAMCRTPIQQNRFDCGLYVMRIAESILDWHKVRRKVLWFDELSERVTPLSVESFMRAKLLHLIESLKNFE
ncbi:hypothetical protein Droror1_Dr00019728 [Drosera rotundifolia]